MGVNGKNNSLADGGLVVLVMRLGEKEKKPLQRHTAEIDDNKGNRGREKVEEGKKREKKDAHNGMTMR